MALTQEQTEEQILEEIRKTVTVRSFRFLSHIQQIKLIRRAIRRVVEMESNDD